jgi:hypothetical protein
MIFGSTNRMPLPPRNFGDLNEEPLACGILEARLDNAKFHGTTGVNEDFGEPCRPTSANFSVNSFSKVQNTRPDGEPPTLISETVCRRVEGECRDVIRIDTVTHETAGGMGVQADHKEESQVVSIPECLETLITNFVVGGRIHKKHDEQHEVARNSTRLMVVNFDGGLLSHLFDNF